MSRFGDDLNLVRTSLSSCLKKLVKLLAFKETVLLRMKKTLASCGKILFKLIPKSETCHNV